VTTHLSHLGGSEEQRGQARELVAWCDALREENGAAVVLCGDMNSTPAPPRYPASGCYPREGAWHVITGSGGWRDCWELAHGAGDTGGLTCPAKAPRMRIDQFFTPADDDRLQVVGVRLFPCRFPVQHLGDDLGSGTHESANGRRWR
jgi:endonuclease/exonuclease/phosphatase family metal-dependent hydrolase